MFHPNYCKHNIRISTNFAIAYAVVIVTALALATILGWIIIRAYNWQSLIAYLACIAIARIANGQLRRNLRHRALWKKYYQDATTDPEPRVKHPACSASIFGPPTSN